MKQVCSLLINRVLLPGSVEWPRAIAIACNVWRSTNKQVLSSKTSNLYLELGFLVGGLWRLGEVSSLYRVTPFKHLLSMNIQMQIFGEASIVVCFQWPFQWFMVLVIPSHDPSSIPSSHIYLHPVPFSPSPLPPLFFPPPLSIAPLQVSWHTWLPQLKHTVAKDSKLESTYERRRVTPVNLSLCDLTQNDCI